MPNVNTSEQHRRIDRQDVPTIEDKNNPEEVIVWKGNYIARLIKDWNKVSGEKNEAKNT